MGQLTWTVRFGWQSAVFSGQSEPGDGKGNHGGSAHREAELASQLCNAAFETITADFHSLLFRIDSSSQKR